MTRYLITANVTVDRPHDRAFTEYQAGDKVATVGYYTVEADDPFAAAEMMFQIGNRYGHGLELNGQEWPSDVRSLSVGDVLYVAGGTESETTSVHILAVASMGYTEVPQPSNACQVRLEGTDATSRPEPISYRTTEDQ